MRCAIYARYSTDKQTDKSIEDQVRVCRAYAEQRGWTVPDSCIYLDYAVSAGGMDRPGLQELLERGTRPQPPFQVFLVDDTSRIARDLADAMVIFRQLRYYGLRAIAVSQSIDTNDEQAQVVWAIHGISDSLYTKELAHKVLRGQEGLFLKGLVTGGRCYGYRNVRVGETSARMEIDPSQATVVTRIFEMSAAGDSLDTIVKRLNGEGIPPPQKRLGRLKASWCPTGVRAMLRNERYIGRVIWNRAKYVKRPGTNKRVARLRPQSEWKVAEMPELRIITDDLWNAVRDRQDSARKQYGGEHPGLRKGAANSSYVLTGLLKCGECGANLVAFGAGNRRHARYGCPQYRRGACSNSLTQRIAEVEKLLFAGLQATILSPEVLDFTFQKFYERMHASKRRGGGGGRREQLKAEIANITRAIAATGHSEALLSSLAAMEAELRSLDSQTVIGMMDRRSLRHWFDGKIMDLPKLIAEEAPRARAHLMDHDVAIRMMPEGNCYRAVGELHLLNRVGRMVAGVGFEPTTFGL